jgi:16S rRNA C967 or C1407 C5-methylase (RsmB/RsmF family)
MKRRTARRQAEAGTEGEATSDLARFLSRLEADCPPARWPVVRAALEGEAPLVGRLHGRPAEHAETLRALDGLGVRALPLDGGAHPVIWLLEPPDGERRVITASAPVDEGRLYLMNPSSLLPGLALSPGPDDAVLDLCAAPGGKTLHLVALMGEGATGPVSAVEATRARFFKLRGQLERFGAGHVRTYLKDGREVGRAVPERFDRVLVDAPCSSEARIRVDDPESFSTWSPRKVKECQHKQLGLLRSGLDALKPGGRLVYCTCSFSREENEEVVARTLAAFEGAVRLVEAGLDALRFTRQPPLEPGLGAGLALTRRVWPDGLWDGFFVAAFEKAIEKDRGSR